MQITPANYQRSIFQNHSGRSFLPPAVEGEQASDKLAKLLDIEIKPEADGLRLLKIGTNSPLRRLAPSGDAVIQGAMEMGDRIVAINGVWFRNIGDVSTLARGRSTWEITIYDHRTCLTVSWNLNFHDEMRAA